MRNKRAVSLNLILLLGLVLALAVFLGFFIFSTRFRFITLGVGLIVMSFIILIGKSVKKQNIKVGVFVILLGVGMVLVLSSGILQQTFQGERYVEVPLFATVECQQSGESAFSLFSVNKDGEWISSKFPTNTNEWSIKVEVPNIDGIFTLERRVEYYICNSQSFSGCTSQTQKFQPSGTPLVINLGTESINRHIWIQLQRRNPNPFGQTWIVDDDNSIKVRVTFKPFILIRDDVLRGGRQQLNVVGCEIPTSDVSWQNRILSWSGSQNIPSFSADNNLNVGEKINYVTGSIVAVSEGNTQSGGWCIYENNVANIYEIEKFTTPSGTYNAVNVDNKIGEDECCNGEVYPGKIICQDGKFIDVEDAECETRTDCGTLEYFVVDDGKVGRYSCVEGKCVVSDVRDAECTENSDCLSNEICSRNTFTCVLAGRGGEGEEIDDGDGGGIKCEWWQEEYTRIEKDYGWLYWRAIVPFFDPIETQVQDCRTAGWVNLTAIILLVGGLGVFAIYMFSSKKKTRRRKK